MSSIVYGVKSIDKAKSTFKKNGWRHTVTVAGYVAMKDVGSKTAWELAENLDANQVLDCGIRAVLVDSDAKELVICLGDISGMVEYWARYGKVQFAQTFSWVHPEYADIAGVTA